MRLTKLSVERAAIPDTGQTFYRDDMLKGFALRVTSNGAKSFVVEKRINNKVKRKTLARFGVLTVEQARKEAQKFLGQVASGHDPITTQKDNRAKTVTLSEAFDIYLKVRSGLKDSTIKDYRRLMSEVFDKWQNRELKNITKDMVQKKHHDYGQRSQARANNGMRLLKAIFNFAKGQYEDSQGRSLFPENPVDRLSHIKAWYRVERRRTLIKKSELAAWFAAVEKLRVEGAPTSETIADYLLLLLLTGLRRSEGMNLQWSDVDFVDRTLTINDTKNREPLILPLSDYLHTLLKHRAAIHESPYVFPNSTGGKTSASGKQPFNIDKWSAESFTLPNLRQTIEGVNLQWSDVDFIKRTLTITETKSGESLTLPLSDALHISLTRRAVLYESSYVFPGSTGGKIIEPRKQLAKVNKWSEVSFTLHDLRRTFITIAESLELSQYAIKHLVNHKTPNDVTAGYIVMDPERLRPPMEKITQSILLAAGRNVKTNIIPFAQQDHAR